MSAIPSGRKYSLPLSGKQVLIRPQSEPVIQRPQLKSYGSAPLLPSLPFKEALEKLSSDSKESPQLKKEELELDQRLREDSDAAAKFAHQVLASVYSSKKS